MAINGKGKSPARPVKPVFTPDETRILKPLLDQDPEIVRVAAKDIIVDDAPGEYQDRERDTYVKKIAKDFSPALLGTLALGRRKDGSIHAMDGGTRVLAMLLRAEPDRLMNSQIFEETTKEQEALYLAFSNSTRARNPTKLITKLQAEHIAGTDRGFGDILEFCGFTLRKGKQQIHGPSYALKAFYLDDYKGEALKRALFTLKEAWRDRYNYKIWGYAVLGVAMLYHSQRRSMDEQVRHVLKNNSPDKLMGLIIKQFVRLSDGREPRIHPDDKPELISSQIAKMINKHPGKTGKVDLAALTQIQEEVRAGTFGP